MAAYEIQIFKYAIMVFLCAATICLFVAVGITEHQYKTSHSRRLPDVKKSRIAHGLLLTTHILSSLTGAYGAYIEQFPLLSVFFGTSLVLWVIKIALLAGAYNAGHYFFCAPAEITALVFVSLALLLAGGELFLLWRQNSTKK